MDKSGQVSSSENESSSVNGSHTNGHSKKTMGRIEKKFGECFERFYKPLLNQKNGDNLAKLANVPIEPLTERAKADVVSDTFLEQLEQRATRLINDLYKLTSETWEENLNVYLRHLDHHLEGLSPEEARILLVRSREKFIAVYSVTIKNRGESILMIDQILKRIGKQHLDQLEKVLSGVNIPELAESLWELLSGDDQERFENAREALIDLTDLQVQELRFEYSTLPARLLAQELHRALHPLGLPEISDTPDEEEELEEHYILEDYREEQAQDYVDLDAIRYLLHGRPLEEIEAIEHQFDDLFHTRKGEGTLREQLLEKLSDLDSKDVLELLEGFSPDRIAQKIITCFQQAGEARVSTAHQFLPVEITGELLVSPDVEPYFPRSNLLEEELPFWHTELERYPDTAQIIRGLTRTQIEAVYQILSNNYNFHLDIELYLSKQRFHARRLASELRDALNNRFSLAPALALVAYLTPAEVRELHEAFLCHTGRSLSELITERAEELLSTDLLPEPVLTLLENRTSGISRIPVEIDLLAQILSPVEGVRGTVSKNESLKKRVGRVAELVRGEQEPANNSSDELLSLLQELADPERLALEYIYLQDFDTPLATEIAENFEDDFSRICQLILEGHDLRVQAEELASDSAHLFALRHRCPTNVRAILEICQEYQEIDFMQLVDDWLEDTPPFQNKLFSLSTILMPEAERLHRFLFTSHDEDGELAVEQFFDRPHAQVKALEWAYSKLYGDLRLDLKRLATLEEISRTELARVSVRLEGVNPEVLEELEELIEDSHAGNLRYYLQENREDLPVLREAYDTIHYDAPVRQAINRMNAPLPEINRTILCLDGFAPELVVREIHGFIHQQTDIAAAEDLYEMLATPDEEVSNYRIPEDPNWTEEMYFQIRRVYRELFEIDLIADLREQEFPSIVVNTVSSILYGEEAKDHVTQIYQYLRQKSTEPHFLTQISDLLKTTSALMRERIVDMYDAYFGSLPGHKRLIEELSSHSNVEPAYSEIRSLLFSGDSRILIDEEEDTETE